MRDLLLDCKARSQLTASNQFASDNFSKTHAGSKFRQNLELREEFWTLLSGSAKGWHHLALVSS